MKIVGDGFPVPRRKAFSYEFGIICVPLITAKMQMTDFLSYAAKCIIINERPCFQRFYPMKTGSFFVCDKGSKSLTRFGTGNPSLTKFHGNLRNKIITHYELRITH